MQFNEFRAGQRIDCGRRTISQTQILDFATHYDPQWFHTDPERAERGRYRGLIASGWHTCGSPGLEYVKWQAPVRPGDELRLEALVLEVRPSTSGQYGILRWQWLMRNARDEVVLDMVATSLFDLTQAQ
jgi:acyl dehydratase